MAEEQQQGGNGGALSTDDGSPDQEKEATGSTIATEKAKNNDFKGPTLAYADSPITSFTLHKLPESVDRREQALATTAPSQSPSKGEQSCQDKRKYIAISIVFFLVAAGTIAAAVILSKSDKKPADQRVELVGEVVILEVWSDKLADNTSEECIIKKAHIETEIAAALQTGNTAVYFESIEVVTLRAGSIIADIKVVLRVPRDGVTNNGTTIAVTVDDSDRKVEITGLIKESIKDNVNLEIDTDKINVRVSVTVRTTTTPIATSTSMNPTVAPSPTTTRTTRNPIMTPASTTTSTRRNPIVTPAPTTISTTRNPIMTTVLTTTSTRRNPIVTPASTTIRTTRNPIMTTVLTTTSTTRNPIVTPELTSTSTKRTMTPSTSHLDRRSTAAITSAFRTTSRLSTTQRTPSHQTSPASRTTIPSVHLCGGRCENGGSCLFHPTFTYRCSCLNGYTGIHCQYSLLATARPWTTNIPGFSCRGNAFQCGSACIPHYWVCDNTLDCADGSDESPYLCIRLTTTRSPWLTTTRSWWQTATRHSWQTTTRHSWQSTTRHSWQTTTSHPQRQTTIPRWSLNSTTPPWASRTTRPRAPTTTHRWWESSTTSGWWQTTTRLRVPTTTHRWWETSTTPGWWQTTTRPRAPTTTHRWWETSTTPGWWQTTTRPRVPTTTHRWWQNATTPGWWQNTTRSMWQTSKPRRCSSGMFQCGGTQCIRSILRCDGYFQCNDGSDEIGCVVQSGSDIRVYSDGEMRPLCSGGPWENALVASAVCLHLDFKRVNSVRVNSRMSIPLGVVFLYNGSTPGYLKNLEGVRRRDCSPLMVECSGTVGQCGRPTVPIHSNYIQYGREAFRGQWPWQAHVKRDGRIVCGGTLINSNWLMTAGHCVRGYSASSLRVILGSHNRLYTDTGQREFSVSRVVVHPRYALTPQTSSIYDIALFQLNSTVNMTNYIHPACLPQKELDERQVCYITGWGQTQGGSASNTLQQIKVSTISGRRCAPLWRDMTIIDNMICTTRSNSRYSPSCYGDSGGPLVCLNSAGSWDVHGVVSFGPRGCRHPVGSSETAWGVFTSVYHFREWIQETTVCHFTCGDGTCLYNKGLICDGTRHCSDGSDETILCVVSPTCAFEYANICGYSAIPIPSSSSRWHRVTINSTEELRHGLKPMDHTTNRFGGYYMHLSEYQGSPTTLLSPVLEISLQPMCLQFYFYLYTKMLSVSGSLGVKSRDRQGNERLLWSVNVSYGKRWNAISVTLPSDSVHFLFVGTGTVSVDDAVLQSGNCPPFRCVDEGEELCGDPAICLQSDLLCDGLSQCHDTNSTDEDPSSCGASVNCTFDEEYICGYRRDDSQAISWQWSQSSALFPLLDHTEKAQQIQHVDQEPANRTTPGFWTSPPTTANPFGTSSQLNGTVVSVFTYNLTALNRTSIADTYLTVPQFTTGTVSCLEFYYVSAQLDGDLIHAKLSLGSRTQNGTLVELWSRSNDQGRKWHLGQVGLEAGTYNLSFQASLSLARQQWQISLDDVRLIPGECPESVVSCGIDEFRCSENQCIPNEVVCDGVANCADAEDEFPRCSDYPRRNLVRLVGGGYPFQGRVEVLRDGRWGSICDSYWTSDIARVICRMLNMSTSVSAFSNSYFGQGPDHWIRRAYCQGYERSIQDCAIYDWGSGYCSKSDHASVRCGYHGISDYRQNNVRLVGNGDGWEGRVEIYHNSEWGTVCQDGWDERDARVVCRMMGYGDEAVLLQRSEFNYGYSGAPVWLSRVNCTGSEARLDNCTSSGWRNNACSYTESVGVRCLGGPASNLKLNRTSPQDSLRLVGGTVDNEGRLEVLVTNTWGTICDDNITQTEINVICKTLGYSGKGVLMPPSSRGSGPIYMDEVKCNRGSKHLFDCDFRLGIHDCDHYEDVHIRCEEDPFLVSVTDPFPLRMVGGSAHGEGRLEIYRDGYWGGVCYIPRFLGTRFCKMLGFRFFVEIAWQYTSSTPNRVWEVWLCNNETCMFWSSRYCSSLYDYVMTCADTDPFLVAVTEPFPMRLVGGSALGEGRLEIFKEGYWAQTCSVLPILANSLCRMLGFRGYAVIDLKILRTLFYYPRVPAWTVSLCINGPCVVTTYCSHEYEHMLNCSHDACPRGMDACPRNDSRGDVVCIKQDFYCDGNPDCPDATDETSCSNCSSSEMVCDGTTCLPLASRCDGTFQCNDGTDEHKCLYRDENDDIMVELDGTVYPLCMSASLNVTQESGRESLAGQICHRLGQGLSSGIRSSGVRTAGVVLSSLDWSESNARTLSTEHCDVAHIRCEHTRACGERFVPEPDQHLSRTANQSAPRYSLEGEWPWYITVSDRGYPLCDGVMILPQWALTACSADRVSGQPNIKAGPVSYSHESRELSVVNVLDLDNALFPLSLVLLETYKDETLPFSPPVCLPNMDRVSSKNPVCYGLGENPAPPPYAPSGQFEQRHSLNTCPYNNNQTRIYPFCLSGSCETDLNPRVLVCQNALGYWDVVGLRTGTYRCDRYSPYININAFSKTIGEAIREECIFRCTDDNRCLYDFIFLCDGTSQCADGSDEAETLCVESPTCTFEYGYCGYNVSGNSGFGWRRVRARGDRDPAVPISDHTTNSSRGYVLSASGNTNGSGWRDLQSPDLDVTQEEQCLSFYWHSNFFDKYNTLTVFADAEGKVQQIEQFRASYYGLYGEFPGIGSDEFTQVAVTLPSFSERFFLRMSSARDVTFSIDDITVTRGSCQSGPVNCSFTSAGLCGYRIIDASHHWRISLSDVIRENTVETPIRLVNGSRTRGRISGRVEVYHSGEWGTICDDSFGSAEASVICRVLGYSMGIRYCCSKFGPGSGIIWLDGLNCIGNEDDVALCPHRTWGSHNCGHFEDVGVECYGNFTPATDRNRHLVFNASYGNVARIVSPVLAEGGCLSFSYRFDGPFGGTLGVYTMDVSKDVDSAGGVLVWSLSSTSQVRWRNVSLPVSAERRIIFEGRGGFGMNEFIRLDDIELVYGDCTQPVCSGEDFQCVDVNTCIPREEVCNSIPSCAAADLSDEDSGICGSITNCSFETGLCGFRNSSDSLGIWKRAQRRVEHQPLNGTPIRLVNGNQTQRTISGRVEVFHLGSWGTVCDDSFGFGEARVICRMLGYSGGQQFCCAKFRSGSGTIWLDDLRCQGNETDLSLCGHRGWGNHNCVHEEDAGVECSDPAFSRLGNGLQPEFHNTSRFGDMAILLSTDMSCTENDGSDCVNVCVELLYDTFDNQHSKLTVFGEDSSNQFHRLWTTVDGSHNTSTVSRIPVVPGVKRLRFISYHSPQTLSAISINSIVFVPCNALGSSNNTGCNVAKFTCKNGDCLDRNLTCDGVADCVDGSDEWDAGCKAANLSCSFENETTCGLSSVTRSSPWQLITLSALQQSRVWRAPSFDHHGKQGTVLFMDTAVCRYSSLAMNELIFPPLSLLNNGACVQFYYNSWAKFVVSTPMSILLNVAEGDVSVWTFAQFHVSPDQTSLPISLLVECSAGGHVLIDDITIKPGSCPPTNTSTKHCPDGEQLLCSDGTFVPCSRVCDRNNDCVDRGDELGCECSEHEFRCGGDEGYGNCVVEDRWCDGHADCSEMYDELPGCSMNPACHFETANICGYSRIWSSGSTSGWRRVTITQVDQGRKPMDHTTERLGGSYMDLSGHQGAPAILLSPVLETKGQPMCLQFYFYLYTKMLPVFGSLDVKSRDHQGNERLLWSVHGSFDKRWNAVSVTLPPNSEHFLIIGTGFVSVDDVTLESGICPPISCEGEGEERCDSPSLCLKNDLFCDGFSQCPNSTNSKDEDPVLCGASVNCTFGEEYICGYRRDDSRELSWRWLQSSIYLPLRDHTDKLHQTMNISREPAYPTTAYRTTPLFWTTPRPTSIFTTTLPSNYSWTTPLTRGTGVSVSKGDLHSNSSWNVTSIAHTYLTIPQFTTDTVSCMEFYYVSAQVGKERVHAKLSLVSTSENGMQTELWSRQNNQGQKWHLGQVELSADTYNLSFMASISLRIQQWQMSLDDVRLMTATCRDSVVSCSTDEFQCSQSQCIPRSDVCDGVANCAGGEDEIPGCTETPLNPVRLVGGGYPFQGRVEVLHNGRWGSICDSYFSSSVGRVVCRMLGLSSNAYTYRYSYFGPGPNNWLGRMSCRGVESSLNDCYILDWTPGYCSSGYHASLRCGQHDILDYRQNNVRLVGNQGGWEGRLEIYHNGLWGTVCQEGWDERDARVVCRMMGYGDEAELLENREFSWGSSFTTVWLSEVNCDGNEARLDYCTSSGWSNNSCRYTQAVGVRCLGGPASNVNLKLNTTSPGESLRLVDGAAANEGRLEVLVGSQWGTICDDNITQAEADIICRSLGYSGKGMLMPLRIPGSGPIYFDEVKCNRSSRHLFDCDFSLGIHDCNHYEDVYIRCEEDPFLVTITEPFPMRLIGGSALGEGRLEIFREGRWGGVCSLSQYYAQQLCSMLGFRGFAEVIQRRIEGDQPLLYYPAWIVSHCNGSCYFQWYPYCWPGYEYTLHCSHSACPSSMDTCPRNDSRGDAVCIRKDVYCDGNPDCPDATDENSCSSCSSSEMVCDGTTCLSLTSRCDGTVQCNDGTDEHRCVYRSGNNQIMVQLDGIGYPLCMTPSLNVTSGSGEGSLADRICYRLGQGFSSGVESSGVWTVGVVLRSLDWSDPNSRTLSGARCDVAHIRCDSAKACGGRFVLEPEQHLNSTSNQFVPRYSLEGEWPWFIGVNRGGYPRCMGLMIAQEWALTTCPKDTFSIRMKAEAISFYNESMQILNIMDLNTTTFMDLNTTTYTLSLMLVNSYINDTHLFIPPVCLPDMDNVTPKNPVCYGIGDYRFGYNRFTLPAYTHIGQFELRASLTNENCTYNSSQSGIQHGCLSERCENNFVPSARVCLNSWGFWEVVGLRSSTSTCWTPYTYVNPLRNAIEEAIRRECIFRCSDDDRCLYDYFFLCDGVPHCTDGSDEAETICIVSPVCTFEYGDCGYSVGEDSRYRWERIRARGDSSDRTVPLKDHTTESNRGYVLSASGNASSSNWRDVRSPDINVTQQEQCLSFFWHTTSDDVTGVLIVYVGLKEEVRQIATIRAVDYKPPLSSPGMASGKFTEAFVTLPPFSERFYLRMIVGTVVWVDLVRFSIDDITVRRGSCQSGSVNCSFTSAGLCGYQVIDNSPHWRIGLPYDANITTKVNTIRLVNGNRTSNRISGRVEVYHSGRWGTVCDDDFGKQEATVICRMLGYANSICCPRFGQGTGTIWLDDLECTGDETNLDVCRHRGWGQHNCVHSEDVGVQCYGLLDHSTNMANPVTSRHLVFDASYGNVARIVSPVTGEEGCLSFSYLFTGSYGGTLRVSMAGATEDLDIVSGELVWSLTSSSQSSWRNVSFPVSGEHRIVFEGRGGLGSNDFIRVDDINLQPGACPQPACSGNETRCATTNTCIPNEEVCNTVSSCSDSDLSDESNGMCGSAANCSFEMGLCGFQNSSVSQGIWTRAFTTPIRLVNGIQTSSTYSGRVEVFHAGQWGTVCDNGFGSADARVICRMLGYAFGLSLCCARFGPGSGRIWLGNLGCSGSDNDVGQCSHSGWGVQYCNHYEDAGVNCYDKISTNQGTMVKPEFHRTSKFGAMATMTSTGINCTGRDGSECKEVCLALTYSFQNNLQSKLTVFGEESSGEFHRLWTTAGGSQRTPTVVTIPVVSRAQRIHITAYHSPQLSYAVYLHGISFAPCNEQNRSKLTGCDSAMYTCTNGDCVNNTMTCDGVADCVDGSDEWGANCTGVNMSCTFEDDHTCGYSSVTRSSPWQLSNLTAIRRNTNWPTPSSDHRRKQGTVLFMDGELCRRSSLIMNELLFPSVNWPRNGACVQFYYNSYSDFTVSTPRGILYNAAGKYSYSWTLARFDVSSDETALPISMMAECYNGRHVIIDDIAVESGSCRSSNFPTNRCPAGGQFQCSNGISLSCYAVCDRYPHCPDGSDEIGCECTEHEFRCGGDEGDGKCVVKGKWCDGRSDCPDMYDEHPGCSCLDEYEFTCNDGSCIRSEDYCDRSRDCLSGEDEASNCSSNCDLPFRFECANGRCVNKNRRCNYINDCGDFSDEMNCTCHEPMLRCEKSGVCYSPSQHCNGYSHCPDGEDEGIHCLACNETQVPCLNGFCIGAAQVCDGSANCFDGSDEWNCSNCDGYQCEQSGKCLNQYRRCNGYVDCWHPIIPDFSDELNCTCSFYQRRCDNGMCKDRGLWCNGVDDCFDNSDERNCSCREDQARCRDGRCIREEWWCDGNSDCPDSSDESDCPSCPVGQQRACFDNVCLDSGSVCDGTFQCEDHTDERQCGSLSGGPNTGIVYFKKSQYAYPLCADGTNDEVLDEICHYITGGGFVKAGRISGGSSREFLIYSVPESPDLPITAQLRRGECASREMLNLTCQNPGCGVQPNYERTMSQVIGGDISERGRWPWVVALHYLNSPLCGGSVVNPNWVITAAHCIYELRTEVYRHPAYIKVVSGVTDLRKQDIPGAQIRNVEKSFKYPGYRGSYDGDFALLKLDRPLERSSDFVSPLCLPTNTTVVAPTSCYVAGWGRTQPGSAASASRNLRHARMSLFNTTFCGERFDGRYNLTDNICAGYINALPGACYGDSGGPLMCKDNAGYWTLVGVVNGGNGCYTGSNGNPTVFARVAYFKEWIDEIIMNNS